MDKQSVSPLSCLLFFFFFLITFHLPTAESSETVADVEEWPSRRKMQQEDDKGRVKLLFVFGDSYVDTGNWKRSSSSWHPPYGSTFPGKPTGRFSDGLVLTDYIASFLGIRSPQPYTRRNSVDKSLLRHGMNFAYGGTGVFNTMVNQPNMTTQIDLFQKLLEQNLYSKEDLSSSVALVSAAGNDYSAYLSRNGNEKDLPAFTTALINQLGENLKRIRGLGVRRVVVSAIEPLGCLPELAAYSSYKNCSRTWNSMADIHNRILQQTIQKLHSERTESKFVILDLHSAFTSALKNRGSGAGNTENPLAPCCVGESSGYSCGSIDGNGVKKYKVCENPNLSFFWDSTHPSQSGWRAVHSFVRSSLYQLY